MECQPGPTFISAHRNFNFARGRKPRAANCEGKDSARDESANITTCKSYEKARNRGIHTYRNSGEDDHYGSDKCDGSSETPPCSRGMRPYLFPT